MPFNRFKSLVNTFIHIGGVFLFGQGMFYLASYGFIYLLSTHLAPGEFSRLTLISSFFFILNIPTDGLYLMVLKYISDKDASNSQAIQLETIHYAQKTAVKLSLVSILAYIALIPAMMWYFHLDTPTAILFFAPTILTLFSASFYKAMLHGREQFNRLGVVMTLEGISKLTWAVLVIVLGFGLPMALLGFCISLAVASVAAYLLGRKFKPTENVRSAANQKLVKHMSQFLRQSMFASFTIALMLSLDVILANHLLTGDNLADYAYLNLYGRIILMIGLGVSALFYPKISKFAGDKKLASVFRLGFITNVFLTGSLVITAIVVPNFLSLIFNQDFASLHGTLAMYAVGCAALTISAYLIKTQVILQKKVFSYIALVYIFLFTVSAHLIQPDLDQYATLFAVTSSINLALVLTLLTVSYGKEQWYQLIQFFHNPPESATIGSNKLRILIYNWRDTKHVWAGGAEVYIQEIAKRWVAEGHQVTLFCSFDRITARDETIDGINIIRRGGFVTVYIWGLLYYIFKFRGQYDYLIDCENGVPFFTPLYTRIPKTLIVHHVHQDVFAENLFFPLAKLAQFLEAHLMPLVYRNTPLVTVSPTSKKAIRRQLFAKNSITIVPCGIDLKQYKPGKKATNPLVVYIGRLKQYKRLEDFVAMAKVLHTQIPEARFTIAGEGDQLEPLRRHIGEQGMDQVIDMPGKITHQQKITLFQQAWVVMNPSSMEGWSITTIEANACSTPVVGADVPGLRDSIIPRVTGNLIPMGNVPAYTLEVFRLLTNTTLRESHSDNARKWAENFTWKASADQFMSHIKNQLSGKSRQGVTNPIAAFREMQLAK